MDNLVARLGDVAVLKGLDQQQLQQLAKHVKRQWFGANETILKEGQMTEAVYIIESGRTRSLHLGDAGYATEVMQFLEVNSFKCQILW